MAVVFVFVVFVEYICIMLWLFLMFSLFLCFLSDEEKVGPWPRGPIFPFRKKALQRPRIFKVKHPKNHPVGLPVCQTQTHPLPVLFVLFCSHLTYFVRSKAYFAHMLEKRHEKRFSKKMLCVFKQNYASHHNALAASSQRSQMFR